MSSPHNRSTTAFGVSKPTLVLLLVVTLFVVTVQTNVPGRLAYAIEKGRIEAMQEELASVEQISNVYRMVARTTLPSVVSITVERGGPEANEGLPPGMPEGLRRFFRQQPDAGRLPPAFGSGVILDEQGHIVTNNHVVRDARRVTVGLHDGRRLRGRVLGTDPKTDLAVLKIDAGELIPIRLGDSEKLEVGDRVLAIGNPFNLESTVTEGIVSAVGRQTGIIDQGYEDFIQTDAAINPGNSGGALVNIRGELVGINTAIATTTGSYNGIGFAIPSKIVKDITDRLKRGEPITRGWLGVSIRDLDPNLARSFGLDHTDGVLVQDVFRGAPAARAGLRNGDIVLEVEGAKVANVRELRNRIASYQPDKVVSMLVFRDGRTLTLRATLGTQPDDLRAIARQGPPRDEPVGDATADKLGLTVAPITPELVRQYDLTSRRGVVVTDINPDGPAAEFDLSVGDVIESVGGREITSVDEFLDAMRQASLADGVRLYVRKPNGIGTYLFLQVN